MINIAAQGDNRDAVVTSAAHGDAAKTSQPRRRRRHRRRLRVMVFRPARGGLWLVVNR